MTDITTRFAVPDDIPALVEMQVEFEQFFQNMGASDSYQIDRDARAFLKDAPILIMDEATSALDSESESVVQKSILKLTRGRTCMVIAHRLSTLKHMDRIIVIDRGRVAEMGHHSELIKRRGGIYARLWKMQSDGFI